MVIGVDGKIIQSSEPTPEQKLVINMMAADEGGAKALLQLFSNASLEILTQGMPESEEAMAFYTAIAKMRIVFGKAYE